MDKLITHLAKVKYRSESWPDWKKGILNSKVSNVDEEKERGITIKPFYYEDQVIKNSLLHETVNNKYPEFLKQVDLAIKEYFMYKYNRDIDELIRISKNVNNFKIKDRFHKVSTLSEMKDCYYDGEYCYLTTVQGYGNGYVVKHWLN